MVRFQSPRRFWWAACLWALSACGADAALDDGAAACADAGEPACTPLFEPNFDELFTRRLAPTCATSSVCHGEGGRAGLEMFSADIAFQALVGEGRVVPGNANCGVLMERLTSKDSGRVMPPGAPLSAAELCSVQMWIAAGAPR